MMRIHTVAAMTYCSTCVFYSTTVAMPAVAVSPHETVEGRVTQTLTIHCEAQGNLDDTAISFTWRKGSEILETGVVDSGIVSGRAASVLTLRGLSVAEHGGEPIQCHPNNTFGGVNFTEFTISVVPFPAPDITSFAFHSNGTDMATAAWQPVNVSGYPDASLDGYYYEIARDSNGTDIVANGTVSAGDISLISSLGAGLSDRYWVRVKAIKGDQDVSAFSDWFPIDVTPTRQPRGVCVLPLGKLCMLCDCAVQLRHTLA